MVRTLKTWRPTHDLMTTGLIAVLVLVWLVTTIHGIAVTGSALVILAPPAELLARWGSPSEPILWRAVAACFLHAGLPHLVLNLMCLKVVAPPVERGVQPLLVPVLFVIGGAVGLFCSRALAAHVGGRFGVILCGGQVPVVGASAGILAIAGGLVAACGMDGDRELAAPVLGWVLKLLVIGLVANALGLVRIDNAGHLAGFLAGIFLVHILAAVGRRRVTRDAALLALVLASVGLMVLAVVGLVGAA